MRAGACLLQGNMPKRRQLIVKDAFERLAANFGGCVTMDVIQTVSRHPSAVGAIRARLVQRECPGARVVASLEIVGRTT